MPLPMFRAFSEAEARAQRRAQVNAMVAARCGHESQDNKAFKGLLKGLTDGE